MRAATFTLSPTCRHICASFLPLLLELRLCSDPLTSHVYFLIDSRRIKPSKKSCRRTCEAHMCVSTEIEEREKREFSSFCLSLIKITSKKKIYWLKTCLRLAICGEFNYITFSVTTTLNALIENNSFFLSSSLPLCMSLPVCVSVPQKRQEVYGKLLRVQTEGEERKKR